MFQEMQKNFQIIEKCVSLWYFSRKINNPYYFVVIFIIYREEGS